MTFEEFTKLAKNPPRCEEPTIFEVIEYDVDDCGIDETSDSNILFSVDKHRVGFGVTLDEAERLMHSTVAEAEQMGTKIYCFHIHEYPLNERLGWGELGVSTRLYDYVGRLLDQTVCSHLDRDINSVYGQYRGRPAEMLRFKDGDKVAILCPDEVRLGIARSGGQSIEWCWDVYQRAQGSGRFTDDFYPLDCSDDQVIVCNPDDPADHEHICPVYLMIYEPRG